MTAFSFLTTSVLIGHGLVSAMSYNGLGLTPQMGWNNWNTFACDVSEELLLGTTEKIVDLGLRDLGYNYVVLDDCWSDGRDSKGILRSDDKKFPHGMKYVADYIHDKNLLFGMYSSAGQFTCAGYEGSLGHEEEDAQYFADNDVDYLKYDNCFNKGQFGTPETSFNRYKAMSDALLKTGRPIFYSLCNWGQDLTFYWGSAISNSWRMSGDISPDFDRPDARCPCPDDRFDCPFAGSHCSIMNILNKVAPMGQNAGLAYGGWNDLDMLEVGVGNLTDDEEKAHFSMWSIVKSPMLIGADVNNLKPSSYSIYSQASVLAVNQDPLGLPAKRMWRHIEIDDSDNSRVELQMWSGLLANGDQVVALLNAGNKPRAMDTNLAEIFHDTLGKEKVSVAWDVYDLWGNRINNETATAITEGKKESISALYNASEVPYSEGLAKEDPRLFGVKIGSILPDGVLNVTVPAHGIGLYRLRPSSESADFLARYLGI